MKWHRATDRQIWAAKRFSQEAPGLSVSQALKRLDECFEVLERARREGKTFAECWAEYEGGQA